MSVKKPMAPSSGNSNPLSAYASGTLRDRDIPAVAGQVLDDVAAFVVIDEVAHLEVVAVLLEPVRDQLRPLVGEHADVRDVLGGDPAARRAELVDPVEQQVLRLRRQIDEQSLGRPRGRLARVEAVVQQCFRPVVAQIDGDRAPVGRWACAQVSERLGLELDHLGLVDLVDDRSVGPRQPVGPGVQARGQDHRLPDPVRRRRR